MPPPPLRRLAATAGHLGAPLPEPAGVAAAAPGAEKVDELFAQFFATGTAPGVAYGVVVDGELVHTGGLGTLRVGEDATPGPHSVFRIASMSKSFIAATVLLLRDEGVLRLDDAAEHWVPELAGSPLASEDSAPPTLRQLLSMNAGYPEDDPWADRLESLPDDEYSALIGEPKSWAFSSGVAYDYSNLGFTILGRVIQNATGRNFRDVVSERIIAPLGMTDTVWSDETIDPSELAPCYALGDDKGPRANKDAIKDDDAEASWVAQPIQKPGTFAALGGIYSSVADLAVWVAGFIDAWPARDGDDSHPLRRSSRREMQQVVTAMPLAVGGGEGVARAQVHGYCMGLMSQEDLVTGRVIGHSGGYPGFGSRMAWHPESKVGVIGLANGRYGGPYTTVPEAVAAVVAEVPRQLKILPNPAVEESIRPTIDRAVMSGDFSLIEPLLSANVDMDEELSKRAAVLEGLADSHGKLTPVEGVASPTPAKASWWLEGERGRVGVSIML